MSSKGPSAIILFTIQFWEKKGGKLIKCKEFNTRNSSMLLVFQSGFTELLGLVESSQTKRKIYCAHVKLDTRVPTGLNL